MNQNESNQPTMNESNRGGGRGRGRGGRGRGTRRYVPIAKNTNNESNSNNTTPNVHEAQQQSQHDGERPIVANNPHKPVKTYKQARDDSFRKSNPVESRQQQQPQSNEPNERQQSQPSREPIQQFPKFNSRPRIPRSQLFRELLKQQTGLANILCEKPKDSFKVMKLYKPVLRSLEREISCVTVALHETSIEAKRIRWYSEKNDDNADESDTAQVNDQEEQIVEDSSSGEENEEQTVPVPSDKMQALDAIISQELTSLLTKEAEDIFEELAPTQDEIDQKNELIEELSTLCKMVFNGSDVHPYGSSASNLGCKGCDIDMCIKLEHDIQSDPNLQMQLLTLIQKAIVSEPAYSHLKTNEQPVTRSRVPILQIKDIQRGFECDICIGSYLGVVNTKMLRIYSEIDPRVRPLIYVVKNWAKFRHINDPPSGSLSSYSYVLMVIQYLQTLEKPILPSLQALITHELVEPADINQPHYVNAFDCRYLSNQEKIKQIWKENVKNTQSLGELVIGFFAYYNTTFDFNKKTVSVRTGKPVDKRSSNVISIEDPFEKRDLGTVVSNDMVPKIIEEFKRAYNILIKAGKIADIAEKRENIMGEVNLYTTKFTYEDHISKDEAEKLLAEGKLKKGILRVNKHRFKEAYVTVEGFSKDILIDGLKSRNRAMHGDAVAIRLEYEQKAKAEMGEKDEDDNQQSGAQNVSGQVVCILEKGSPSFFACTLMKQDTDQQKGFRWLIPMDKVYPKLMVQFDEFKSVFNCKGSDLEEVLMIGEINNIWLKNKHYPKGKILGVLGLKRDLWSQKRAILMQNMPIIYAARADTQQTSFSVAVSKETKVASNLAKNKEFWEINNIEIDVDAETQNGYRDWRKRRVFTIDPLTSRDLDDALSIEQVDNEWYNVTVYVADVTRFVTEGSDIDLEARKRATSVYMIDSAEPMLDRTLSQNLCSLLPGVTRFSVAVQFLMSKQGEVKKGSVEFARCIISSCCRMDYDSVQQVIEGRDVEEDKRKIYGDFKWEDIKSDLVILNTMTQAIRKKRFENGSVSLSSEELNFDLDEDGYPVSFSQSVHNESHQLIEEYALLANQLAATTLHTYYKSNCVLRQHSPPGAENWAETVMQMAIAIHKMKESMNVLDPTSTMINDVALMLKQKRSTQEIMNKLIHCTEGYPFMQAAVKHALLREMKLAKYARAGDCDETDFKTHHFALNMEFYTHFTSPIRRYADILVHRQLLQYLRDKDQNIPNPKPSIRGEELSEIIENINEQSYKAALTQDACQKQYLAYYLMPKVAKKVERVEAVVMSVGRRAFTVYVPEYCTEIKVNIMKQFVPVPQSLSEIELSDETPSVSETEDEKGVMIESLTITWANPDLPKNNAKERARYEALNRSLEVRPLKQILVDLDVVYDSVPCDIFVYNAWDLEDKLSKNSGKTLFLINSASTTYTHKDSPVNEEFLKEKKRKEKQEMKEKFAKKAQQRNRSDSDPSRRNQTAHEPKSDEYSHFGGSSSRGRGNSRGGGRGRGRGEWRGRGGGGRGRGNHHHVNNNNE